MSILPTRFGKAHLFQLVMVEKAYFIQGHPSLPISKVNALFLLNSPLLDRNIYLTPETNGKKT